MRVCMHAYRDTTLLPERRPAVLLHNKAHTHTANGMLPSDERRSLVLQISFVCMYVCMYSIACWSKHTSRRQGLHPCCFCHWSRPALPPSISSLGDHTPCSRLVAGRDGDGVDQGMGLVEARIERDTRTRERGLAPCIGRWSMEMLARA